MKISEYINYDATALAEFIRKGETTPKELLKASLEQLESINPSLNAVVSERMDKALKELDRYIEGDRPFNGVPVLLKNTGQQLMGERTTSGSKLLKEHASTAKQDSHFVRAFRDAGFQFIGHTNTPEFGLKNITEPEIDGATRNPWNLEYSPGGSSGGSAAAIAAGIVPLAGASDGGGSIRIPASFTGLFGLKPTRGRTPVGPGVGRQWHGAAIDFVLSKTVRDSAAMLDVLQTTQPEAAFQAPLYLESYLETMYQTPHEQLRIAYSVTSPVGTPVSNDAKEAVLKTVRWLERQGCFVEERDPDIDGKELMRNYYLMNSGEIATLMMQLEKMIGRKVTSEDVEIETWLLHCAGQTVSAAEFSHSLASWDEAAEKMAHFHKVYDFYITPATAYVAPKVGELTWNEKGKKRLIDQMEAANAKEQQEVIYDMFLPSLTYTPFTQLANLTGQPAMSLPLHLTYEQLPLGVQVMANKGEEHRLLQLAYQLEQSDLWQGMQGNPYFDAR
ncbi:amidase [Virgibacillus pantothenticus]|uniref:Amidase n=1 Tax=Virgibacillus pantothenticus TaxID=1473 RepID=A0A0L0QL12_VIRPA|nr:amidase [Virgibacillus pantothenticus]KNE19315.1 amidase [Virgibacillus pantothenticus]MBU8567649.1 amidase [Virgibacillus pantothenticus]MBU8602322.1 amidase [Virgibacillus pantothenticus]MBU8635676.1 amidase [Virgibacillus pantothenticus]MBU8644272.1 amidase [Virgibacillus pantothenticus]